MKNYIRRAGNITNIGTIIQIECECSGLVFDILHDVSTKGATVLVIKCGTCGQKYDVRINPITQKYIKEIEE